MQSFILFIFLYSGTIIASNNIVSHFGFSTDMPEGWFVISPKKFAQYNQKETLESLGIPDKMDKPTLDALFDKAKDGNIEFYYDNLYFNELNKNHVSVQLSTPMIFKNIEELKSSVEEECKKAPKSLSELYGETVNLLSCQLVPSNGFAVIHHAYVVPSLGLTIINETVPINKKYSIVFVGGSGNDHAGLIRMREAQQSLIDSLTSFMKQNAK